MINTVNYEVNLYLNGNLIGDCRSLAQNLNWVRRRTKVGADSIDFTINDVLFNKWCLERNLSINDLLKPLALECRIVRNGTELVGGFLATMPSYSPLNASANLSLRFDGFLNLLAGVYIRNTSNNLPLGTISGAAGTLIKNMITLANWICERCDNQTGAGPFDVYFRADKTYDIYASKNFGNVITDWVAFYPTLLNNTSATSISAAEVADFASAVFGIGSGEVSADSTKNTALIRYTRNVDAVAEFGYMETLYQESSISTGSVLLGNINAKLERTANPIWQPQITLHGKQVAPVPAGSNKIWIGDTITINNSADLTGMTNGAFRVNELAVAVSASGDETITPVLERV